MLKAHIRGISPYHCLTLSDSQYELHMAISLFYFCDMRYYFPCLAFYLKSNIFAWLYCYTMSGYAC